MIIIPLISFEDDAEAYYKAAHDIKGVANRMLSLVQIFADEREGLSVEQNMYLDFLIKEANLASRLTTDYMALCKIKYQYKEVVKTTWEDILKPSLPKMQQLANERKVDLSLEGLNTAVLINPKIAEQLLFHLIQNALLYSDTQKTNRFARLSITNRILTIQDNGVGMAEDKIEAAFKPFVRIQPDLGLDQSTGIGLAIIREIVYRYQGKLQVESQLQQGTSILIQLPD